LISKGKICAIQILRGFDNYRHRSVDFIETSGKHSMAAAARKDRHRYGSARPLCHDCGGDTAGV